MNLNKFHYVSVSVIALSAFFMSNPSTQASNINEEENKRFQIQKINKDEFINECKELQIMQYKELAIDCLENYQRSRYFPKESYDKKIKSIIDTKKRTEEDIVKSTDRKINEFDGNRLSLIKYRDSVNNEIKGLHEWIDNSSGEKIIKFLGKTLQPTLKSELCVFMGKKNTVSYALKNFPDYHKDNMYILPDPGGMTFSS